MQANCKVIPILKLNPIKNKQIEHPNPPLPKTPTFSIQINQNHQEKLPQKLANNDLHRPQAALKLLHLQQDLRQGQGQDH